MTSQVYMISLVGISVVFAFLILMYLILSSFKFLIYNKKTETKEHKIKQETTGIKTNIPAVKPEGDIPQEEIAAIMAVLNNYNNDNLRGKKVIINKRR